MMTGSGRDRAALRTLLGASMSTHAPLVAGLIVAQMISAFGTLAQPALQGALINDGVLAGDPDHINRIAVLMIGTTALALAAGLGIAYFGSGLSAHTAAALRERVYRRVMYLARGHFDHFGTNTLITRSTADVVTVTGAQFALLTVAASAPLLTIGAVIGAVGQAPGLSPLIVIIALILAVAVGAVVARMLPLAHRNQRALDRMNGTLRSQITGTRVIRAFGRERLVESRFEDLNTEVTTVARRLGILQIVVLPVVLFVVNATTVVAMLGGASLIDDGAIRIGQLTAFTGYLTQVAVGISLLVAVTAVLPRAIVSAGRIQEVLETPTTDPGATYVPATGRAVTLEFRSASYRYPGADRAAIRDIDLVCAPGTLTAVVGGTASGKSTLLSMIPRLIDPTGGELLACGVDTRYWSPAALRALIGYVGDGQSLLAGDVADNLRLGRPDVTDEQLWEALETAQATDFVRARDGGLHAPVRQGGINFSGGQRQRLTVARAVLGRPGVLCLDDSLSALDRHTARRVLDAIRNRQPGATIVLSTRQPGLLGGADTIAMMDAGRIVARGTEAELRAWSPEYRELWRTSAGLPG